MATVFLGALPSLSVFSPSPASCLCCSSSWSGNWGTTHLCLSESYIYSSSPCQTSQYATAPLKFRTNETDAEIVWSIHTHVLPDCERVQRAKEWCQDVVLDVDTDLDGGSGGSPRLEIRIICESSRDVSPPWTNTLQTPFIILGTGLSVVSSPGNFIFQAH